MGEGRRGGGRGEEVVTLFAVGGDVVDLVGVDVSCVLGGVAAVVDDCLLLWSYCFRFAVLAEALGAQRLRD